jgi:hypothetical protein
MPVAIAAYISLGDSVPAHLAPGEEIVEVGEYTAMDFWKPHRTIRGVTAPGASGPFGRRQVGAAITNRRLLLFTLGGLTHDRADSVLLEVPIADVQAIVCESHWWKSFEVRLLLRDAAYPFLVAHIGRGRRMAEALEDTRSTLRDTP